jgi:hypothetical protein
MSRTQLGRRRARGGAAVAGECEGLPAKVGARRASPCLRRGDGRAQFAALRISMCMLVAPPYVQSCFFCERCSYVNDSELEILPLPLSHTACFDSLFSRLQQGWQQVASACGPAPASCMRALPIPGCRVPPRRLRPLQGPRA